MNQVLIKNWNNTVKKEDRIFVLGDFCLSGKDKIIEIGLLNLFCFIHIEK